MARTSVRTVIDRAHELIGQKSPDQELTNEAARGLEVLNRMLASYSNTAAKIPYFETVEFTLSAGKAEYVFTPSGGDVDSKKIAELEAVQLRDNQTLYALGSSITADAYYNTHRVLTTSGLPAQVFLQQSLDSSTIIFLPKPNQSFTGLVTAKFEVFPVLINDDLESYVPANWDDFIIFDLAYRLHPYYKGSVWDDNLRKIHAKLQSAITAGTDRDPHVDYDPRLAPVYPYNYYGGTF